MQTLEQELPSGLAYRWQPQERVSAAEYLRRECLALEKSEYYDGMPYPMAGVSRNHIFISANVLDALRDQLRKTECVAVGSDMRISVRRGEKFYYPDAVVVCGEERYVENQPQANLLNPTLIVEVLSSSTEDKDRGEKFEAYRRLDSFEEYVLISQARRHVEVFRKNEAGHWELHEFGSDARFVALATKSASLSMEAIYEDVAFEEADTP